MSHFQELDVNINRLARAGLPTSQFTYSAYKLCSAEEKFLVEKMCRLKIIVPLQKYSAASK